MRMVILLAELLFFTVVCAGKDSALHSFQMKPPNDGWMGMAMAHTTAVVEEMVESQVMPAEIKKEYLKW